MLPSEGPNDYSKECTRLTEEKQVHNDTIHTHSHGNCQEEDKEIKGEENDDSLDLELILPCESKPAEITYAGKSDKLLQIMMIKRQRRRQTVLSTVLVTFEDQK